jgi:hypothetical protein
MSEHPRGSGVFSVAAGICFVIVFVVSTITDLLTIDPYRVFQAWLMLAAVILGGWGADRIARGDKSWRIGQDTINFVIGITAVTFALLTLVSERKACSHAQAGDSRTAPGTVREDKK